MDSVDMKSSAKRYEDFLRDCRLVEEERLPQHEIEIAWRGAEPVAAELKKSKTAKRVTQTILTDEVNLNSAPFLDLEWSVELELLSVADDGKIPQDVHLPLENSSTLSEVVLNSPFSGPSTSAPATEKPSSRDRMRVFRNRISHRIRGLRSGDRSRTSGEQQRSQNPEYALVAAIKWDGPSDGGFSVLSATLSLGRHTMAPREPLSAHFINENWFVMDSCSALEWGPEHRYGMNRRGVHSVDRWLNLFGNSGIRLTLTIQLNQRSIPRIGFPFAQFLGGDQMELEATVASLTHERPLDTDHVAVRGTDGQTYVLPKENLCELSSYFRALLAERWEHSGDGETTPPEVQFPQVPPFTTCPDLIPFVVYYFVRKNLLYGLSENAADLVVAADALGMPELTRLAEIAVVPNMTLENVTCLVRLAWKFQAGLLFRASLIFLRANYDEIWVKDREDLADLGKLLSSGRFLKAFKEMSFS